MKKLCFSTFLFLASWFPNRICRSSPRLGVSAVKLIDFLTAATELLAEDFFEVGLECGDVVFFDAAGGDDLFAAGQRVFIAPEVLGHAGDGLLAEFVRLLNDGAVDIARLDAFESFGVFVEADDFDFARLTGAADGVEDGRTVVAPEADEAGDVGILDEVSSALRRAFMLSVPSVRMSRILMFEPASSFSMPALRSLAFWASSEPTKSTMFPPLGRASLINLPASTPAAVLSVPM